MEPGNHISPETANRIHVRARGWRVEPITANTRTVDRQHERARPIRVRVHNPSGCYQTICRFNERLDVAHERHTTIDTALAKLEFPILRCGNRTSLDQVLERIVSGVVFRVHHSARLSGKDAPLLGIVSKVGRPPGKPAILPL